MKNGTALDVGIFAEFVSATVGCLPRYISKERVQSLIENKANLRRLLEFALEFNCSSASEWEKFYKDYFNMYFSFSHVTTHSPIGAFDRVIIDPVVKKLGLDEIVEVCRNFFSVVIDMKDSDWKVLKHAHEDKHIIPYFFLVRNIREADIELTGSVEEFLKKNTDKRYISLSERLLFELKYWSETDKHLDNKSPTLCLESVFKSVFYKSYFVPCVSWVKNKLVIDIYRADRGAAGLRSREKLVF